LSIDEVCDDVLSFRDDDYDDEQPQRRRSKRDISFDDIDDVGTPNSTLATGCSIPDGQCLM